MASYPQRNIFFYPVVFHGQVWSHYNPKELKMRMEVKKRCLSREITERSRILKGTLLLPSKLQICVAVAYCSPPFQWTENKYGDDYRSVCKTKKDSASHDGAGFETGKSFHNSFL